MNAEDVGGKGDLGERPANAEVVVTVPDLVDGMRVDRVVAMLCDVPRSVAARLILDGRVHVDDVGITTASAPLRAGAILRVELFEEKVSIPPADPNVVFRVVHEDEYLIVVDKPADLIVHPGAGHTEGTLVSGLLARYPDLADLVGVCPPERPGIVQRLDRGTSGLLVVARTEPAYHSLVSQLASRSVIRRYTALVHGLVADDEGVVDAPIGRSARTPTKMAVTSQGKPARTRYSVVQRFETHPFASGSDSATLLSLTLETGRTHQIRVHLSAIGHPVVGDDRYGRSGRRTTGQSGDDPSGSSGTKKGTTGQFFRGRLFLHAAELGFVHPHSGTEVRWTSPLPKDLAKVIEAANARPE